MKLRMKLMVAVAACASLSVGAADEPKVTPELVIEMITTTRLGPDGKQVGGRIRQMRTMMSDGKGAIWSTLIGAEYTLQKGSEFWHLNPNDMANVGKPRQRGPIDLTPTTSRRSPIRSGVLGKKVEEGITIAGEWNEYATTDGGPGVERREIWWRGDLGGAGQPVMRIHRLVSTSPTRITKKDYWYIRTDRIHPEMFDPNP